MVYTGPQITPTSNERRCHSTSTHSLARLLAPFSLSLCTLLPRRLATNDLGLALWPTGVAAGKVGSAVTDDGGDRHQDEDDDGSETRKRFLDVYIYKKRPGLDRRETYGQRVIRDYLPFVSIYHSRAFTLGVSSNFFSGLLGWLSGQLSTHWV